MARTDYTRADLTVTADWADAASPITYRYSGERESEDSPTVFQVANAGHDAARAWDLVAGWLTGDSG